MLEFSGEPQLARVIWPAGTTASAAKFAPPLLRPTWPPPDHSLFAQYCRAKFWNPRLCPAAGHRQERHSPNHRAHIAASSSPPLIPSPSFSPPHSPRQPAPVPIAAIERSKHDRHPPPPPTPAPTDFRHNRLSALDPQRRTTHRTCPGSFQRVTGPAPPGRRTCLSSPPGECGTSECD